jgi:hypothetical protein
MHFFLAIAAFIVRTLAGLRVRSHPPFEALVR